MNILLVHGLGRTPYSMKALGRFLEHQDHTPHYFGYAAFAEPYEQIVIRLQQRIQVIISQSSQPYAIVAHSLGGLLSRSALADRAIAAPHALIMLGTPNQSPQAARWAWQLWPFQWFAQTCGQNLATPSFFEILPFPHFPYRIIAGTGGWRGAVSPFKGELNDGLVTLPETLIKPHDKPVTLPVFHTFMMNDGATQETVARFLTETL